MMDSSASAHALARTGVTVRIPPALQSFTQGRDEVLVEARDADALLRQLDAEYPGLRGRVLDETGRTRPYVNVFVNEELVRGPLDRVALAPGDTVFILPSVAGGAIGQREEG